LLNDVETSLGCTTVSRLVDDSYNLAITDQIPTLSALSPRHWIDKVVVPLSRAKSL
jgi:hypothetical protein